MILAGASQSEMALYFIGRATTVFQITLVIYEGNLRTKTDMQDYYVKKHLLSMRFEARS